MNSGNLKTNYKVERNQIKSNDIFENLKSNFFLEKLFNNLEKKKSLCLLKYNKNLRKRIKITINDYKEYSEIYSSIEIEIKLTKDIYGAFININNGIEKYYHIYINYNKGEIKRNYLNENENVEKLKIIIDYQVKSFKGLFDFCKSNNNK